MTNELLINLTNSVLGSGTRTSNGNIAYHCPFCNHRKKKLEINFSINKKQENPYHCWVCEIKGRKLYHLFKKLDIPIETLSEVKKLTNIVSNEDDIEIQNEIVSLPKEFKSLINDNSIDAKRAKNYLRSRKVTEEDIIKYNLGYCNWGKYKDMIIIPSYDKNGKLNYFTARNFNPLISKKYGNPHINRDIIPFELFINWDLPVILCEGPFDALAIKRNAIPLLGKNIQNELLKKLISSQVKKIYISLDGDALKQTLKIAEFFINEGKEIYIVDLDDKDPSNLGFLQFTQKIQKTYPLTLYDLIEKRLSL